MQGCLIRSLCSPSSPAHEPPIPQSSLHRIPDPNSPLGAGTAISIDGSTLRYTGSGSIGLNTFNRTIALGANGGIVDTSTPANFWLLSGLISGPGSFTKIGSRQMILQAANTYDGFTFINEGEVQIRTFDSLGSTVGHTVVANNTRLGIGMGGNGNGALQTNDAGVVPTFSGSITLNGDAGIGGTASPVVPITLSGAVGGSGGLIKVNGNALTLTPRWRWRSAP
jgi:fibronectin-binding autotransporter adhesin